MKRLGYNRFLQSLSSNCNAFIYNFINRSFKLTVFSVLRKIAKLVTLKIMHLVRAKTFSEKITFLTLSYTHASVRVWG